MDLNKNGKKMITVLKKYILIWNWYIALFSIMLAASFVLGKNTVALQDTYFLMKTFTKDILKIIGIAVFIYFLLLIVMAIISKRGIVLEPRHANKKVFFISWLLIFICYIPYYVAFFPSILCPDAHLQLQQIEGVAPLSNHHPVLHTMLISICLKIGEILKFDHETSISVYSILQMLIVSCIFAYAVYFLYKRGIRKWMVIVSLLYFALNPVHGYYSVYMTKDVLFGVFVLLFIIKLINMIDINGDSLKSKSGVITFTLTILPVVFLRNNGIYLILFTAPFLILCTFYLRKDWIRMTAIFLCTILFVVIVQGPVFELLKIKKSAIGESLSLPIQQIGRVIAQEGNISEEQTEAIDRIIPIAEIKERYAPGYADPIKFSENFNKNVIEENKLKYFSVWASLFIQNPGIYTEAFLCSNVGYWYPEKSDWVSWVFFLERQRQQGIPTYMPDTKINRVMIQFMPEKLREKYPIFTFLQSLGYMFWYVIFAMIMCMHSGNKKYIIALLPLAALWLSLVIASPVNCETRYMYSFFTALPLTIMLMITKRSHLS